MGIRSEWTFFQRRQYKCPIGHEKGNSIKNNQSEMKNAISEIKNTLVGINKRLNEEEDQISDLEEKRTENIGKMAVRYVGTKSTTLMHR